MEETKGYILAIDVGTTSIRAHLFDHNAQIISNKSEPIPLITPKPGHVEQDPVLLIKQCKAVIRAVMDDLPNGPSGNISKISTEFYFDEIVLEIIVNPLD
jgi:glycerol kinase